MTKSNLLVTDYSACESSNLMTKVTDWLQIILLEGCLLTNNTILGSDSYEIHIHVCVQYRY